MAFIVNVAQFDDRNQTILSSNYFHAKSLTNSNPFRLHSSMKTVRIRVVASKYVLLSIDSGEPFLISPFKSYYYSVSPNSSITSITEVSSDSIQPSGLIKEKSIVNITEYDDMYRPLLNVTGNRISGSFELLNPIDINTIDENIIIVDEKEVEDGIEDFTEVGFLNTPTNSKSFRLYIDQTDEIGNLYVEEVDEFVSNAPNYMIFFHTESNTHFTVEVDHYGVLRVMEVFDGVSEESLNDQMMSVLGMNVRRVRVVTNENNVYLKVVNINESVNDSNMMLLTPNVSHEFIVKGNYQQKIIVTKKAIS